jgi:hypothetical protein
VNIHETFGDSVTVVLPNYLEDTRRDLIALRLAHGADTPIGHRCSNIIELIQEPKPPRNLIRIQMNDLAKLMAGLQ